MSLLQPQFHALPALNAAAQNLQTAQLNTTRCGTRRFACAVTPVLNDNRSEFHD